MALKMVLAFPVIFVHILFDLHNLIFLICVSFQLAICCTYNVPRSNLDFMLFFLLWKVMAYEIYLNEKNQEKIWSEIC